jgi:hypothetical protein
VVVQDEAAEVAELADSGTFLAAWYRERNPDVIAAELDPLLHFVRFGAAEGRWPNPWFDPAWYRTAYPDVVVAEMNPLLHYIRHGDQEGRRPAEYFDPAWYRAAHGLSPDMPALRHFLTARISGRFAPCPALYAVPGLPRYRDDPTAGVDPFRHYLDDAEHDGANVLPDEALLSGSGLVDANYYFMNGSDVQEAHLDPTVHYCRYGWMEGRKPNLYFDTPWYLATNELVERLKLNPLVHYRREGEAANRRPVPYFDPGWYRVTYAVPPEQSALAHFLAHRRSQTVSPTPLFDVAWYVAQHTEEIGPNRDPFAHYLHAATYADIDPSPAFNAADYRQRHLGRRSRGFGQLATPEKDNALAHHLIASYRGNGA